MAHHLDVDDIEDEIGGWESTTTSVSNYERMVQAAAENHRGAQLQPATRGRGRGRGIISSEHMASVRLASEISDLKCHSFPMGHLPTSRELLARSAENEITPLLRQLGLNSREDEIHSSSTRKTVSTDEEIRVDGNVPVILNADLFRHCETSQDDEGIGEPETFDPEQPVGEQFSTIPELCVPEEDDIPVVKTISKKPDSKSDSVDSALNSSGSSTQSKKGGKKGGKSRKWRKLTPEELVAAEPKRDRYEEVYSYGVHDNTQGNVFTTRQLHGADGLKGWSRQVRPF